MKQKWPESMHKTIGVRVEPVVCELCPWGMPKQAASSFLGVSTECTETGEFTMIVCEQNHNTNCCQTVHCSGILCRARDGVCGVAGDVPPPSILAHACLALTATSQNDGSIRGCIVLFATSPMATLSPTIPGLREIDDFATSKAKAKGVMFPSGMLVPLLIVDPDHEQAVLSCLLQTAFECCPCVVQLVLMVEAEIPLSQPYHISHFIDSRAKAPGVCLYEARINSVRQPHVSVRQ